MGESREAPGPLGEAMGLGILHYPGWDRGEFERDLKRRIWDELDPKRVTEAREPSTFPQMWFDEGVSPRMLTVWDVLDGIRL